MELTPGRHNGIKKTSGEAVVDTHKSEGQCPDYFNSGHDEM